ncbi:MAG: hypothetical protein HYZ16_09020 [Bacteroidetes bacterium]|nr:hypothetical protein [Bacteroidota bacterium]
MIAYHSEMTAFDTYGIGSAILARSGQITKEIMDKYHPDIVIFCNNPILNRSDSLLSPTMAKWITIKSYNRIGEIYWKPNYTLALYANTGYESITNLCSWSKLRNEIPEEQYLIENFGTLPFTYWHE